jgi:thiol:disulfide interchange protein
MNHKVKADLPMRGVVLVLGVVYLALALSGFIAISDNTYRGGDLLGGNEGDFVWGVFGTSTVTNFVDALLGALLVVAGLTLDRSPTVGWMTTIAFGLMSGYALVASSVDYGDPLNLNWPDTVRYIASAIIVAAAMVLSRRRAERIRAR